jgi:hypothetical protein
MDTAWIQVVVLTVAECVAPAGKSVCQEREFELQFLTQSECEFALEQLITLKDASDIVIVDKNKSSCAPSARQQSVFASLADVMESVEDKQGWRAPDIEISAPGSAQTAHKTRVESLATCDESQGVPPCSVGDIIIEDMANAKQIDVWRRE